MVINTANIYKRELQQVQSGFSRLLFYVNRILPAVPVGEDAAKFHGMLKLNRESADILELLYDSGEGFDGMFRFEKRMKP